MLYFLTSNRTISYQLVALFMVVFIAAGCQNPWPQDPGNSCLVDGLPALAASDYCKPSLRDFDATEPIAASELPFFKNCSANYDKVTSFQLDVPAKGVVYLHRYQNFSGQTALQFIGTNCKEDDYELLSDCSSNRSEAILGTYEVNAEGYSTVIVRVFYDLPDVEHKPVLSFATFTDRFEPVDYVRGKNNNGEDVRRTVDCRGRLNSFILRPAPGLDLITEVKELGLDYKTCDCDQEMVEVAFPAGIDANRVRPRVIRDSTADDTTRFSLNFLVTIPLNPLAGFNSQDPTNGNEGILTPSKDPMLINNPCLAWQKPVVGPQTNTFRVAIIDSGVDTTLFKNEIGPEIAGPDAASGCLTMGNFGYDFLNRDRSPEDQSGHGTMVSSAYLNGLQINHPVRMSHYKIFADGKGSFFDAMCATTTAIKSGHDLINLSWGFSHDTLPEVLRQVLDLAQANNVIVVASAGNDSSRVDQQPSYWPAAAGGDYDNMLTIGAYYMPGDGIAALTDFSNFGENPVELAAIYGLPQVHLLGGGFSEAAGTSISAPIAARYLSQTWSPGSNAADVVNKFLSDDMIIKEFPGLNGQIRQGRCLLLPVQSNGCQ